MRGIRIKLIYLRVSCIIVTKLTYNARLTHGVWGIHGQISTGASTDE